MASVELLFEEKLARLAWTGLLQVVVLVVEHLLLALDLVQEELVVRLEVASQFADLDLLFVVVVLVVELDQPYKN